MGTNERIYSSTLLDSDQPRNKKSRNGVKNKTRVEIRKMQKMTGGNSF